MKKLYRFIGGAPESDQCVLFLHGNSLDHEIFNSFFKSQFLSSYKLVAPDLPGHGKSSKADSDDVYSVLGLTRVLEQFISEITCHTIVIIGHSLGGHIGIHLAAQVQSRIKKLVLIETPPLGSIEDMQKGFNPHELMGLAYKKDISIDEANQLSKAYGLKDSSFLAKKILATDGQFKESLLNSFLNSPYENEIEKLRNLNFPILMLHGEDDPFINVEYIEARDINLSGEKVHRIENAGHCGFYENPTPYLELIESYLTR